VSGNQWELRVRQITVDHMEIGTADRARGDFDEHLARAGPRRLSLNQPERMASSLEHHRLHASTSNADGNYRNREHLRLS